MGKNASAAAVLLASVFGWTASAQTELTEDKWAVSSRAGVIARQSVLPDSTALVKSLGDAAELLSNWKPPADAAAWRRRRPEVERAFRASIGLATLPERSPLNPRTVARHDFGDHVVENVVFESRPGFPVTANLYRPKSPAARRRPAILSPIGHHLGAGKTAEGIQARSIALARMGFIVLTYDAIGQGERMFPGNVHHEAGYALMPVGETIAGLIAPRPLLLLQGEYDAIFQVEGARRAARGAGAVYAALGHPERVRLDVVPGQPHAYSRPFRERMYGWMAQWLLVRGGGEPLPEPAVEALPENDARLLCDPQGAVIRNAPTVVELARRRALRAVETLDARGAGTAASWVARLTAPPDAHPHYLAAGALRTAEAPGGTLQKISFVSEEGQYIPGLLWLPPSEPLRTVILVDGQGKAAAAESGLVEPLLENGYAVLSVDLRGRGETLGRHRDTWDTNFRLVKSQVLQGRPLPGRRAFDLTRTVDYLARRGLPLDELAVVARGEDVLPALLAAAADNRIRRVAAASYVHSFVSQMLAGESRDQPRAWNHPQLRGKVEGPQYETDFGSVIPDALRHADVAEIAALIAPRPVLFCQARDQRSVEDRVRARLARVLRPGAYRPDAALDARLLMEWLRGER